MNACTVTFHNVIGADAAVVAFVVAEHCRVRCCDLLLYCLHLLLLFSLRLPDTVVVRQPDVTSDTNILAPNFSVAAWSNQSPNIDNRCEPKIKIFFHTASVLLSLRLVARATRQQKKRPNTYRKDMMDAHTHHQWFIYCNSQFANTFISNCYQFTLRNKKMSTRKIKWTKTKNSREKEKHKRIKQQK